MTNSIRLSEDQITDKIHQWLCECDSEELARITGEIFGGECFESDNEEKEYEFTPNENYTGSFGGNGVNVIDRLGNISRVIWKFE